MKHAYKEYEDTKLWKLLENGLKDLMKNNDIELTTKKEYVVGYLCKKIEESNSIDSTDS